jgi:hypothetical protein
MKDRNLEEKIKLKTEMTTAEMAGFMLNKRRKCIFTDISLIFITRNNVVAYLSKLNHKCY